MRNSNGLKLRLQMQLVSNIVLDGKLGAYLSKLNNIAFYGHFPFFLEQWDRTCNFAQITKIAILREPLLTQIKMFEPLVIQLKPNYFRTLSPQNHTITILSQFYFLF